MGVRAGLRGRLPATTFRKRPLTGQSLLLIIPQHVNKHACWQNERYARTDDQRATYRFECYTRGDQRSL